MSSNIGFGPKNAIYFIGGFLETLLVMCKITQGHIPKDHNIYNENLKYSFFSNNQNYTNINLRTVLKLIKMDAVCLYSLTLITVSNEDLSR
jgi:hypothetical protein